MSEQQITQIMKALEEQNKALEAIRQEQREAKKKIEGMEVKLEPIHQMFDNVNGFNRIGLIMVKALLGTAALIGALGTILYFIRQLIIKD